MEQKIWAKTLLSSYNCLEKISSAIDSLVVSQGVSSARNHLSTIENAEKIINLIQRKKLLINLKVLIEQTIAELSTSSAKILVLKFFDRVKSEVCLEVLAMPRRTFFRRVDGAIAEFASKLKQHGYDSDMLKNMLKNERWIVSMHTAFSKTITAKTQTKATQKKLKLNIQRAVA